MENLKLSPPWVEFATEIMELFKEDPDVEVKFIDEEKRLKLYVDDTDKRNALAQLLPKEKDFGSVKMTIELVPSNRELNTADLFCKAFKGNPAVVDIETVDVFSNPITYVSFKKEVVQYYNDNLGDLHGNKSTLMECIARDVFDVSGVSFCTDIDIV